MKKNIILKALFLSIISIGFVHTESIIMKKTASGIEALSDHDITTHQVVINQILEKYQWPMCQMSHLTPKEQYELLSPEGNEEQFLEQKLNEMIPAKDRDFEFRVIFVPRTLYELFLLKIHYKENPLYLSSYWIYPDTNTVNSKKIAYAYFRKTNQLTHEATLYAYQAFTQDFFSKKLHLEAKKTLQENIKTQSNTLISIYLKELCSDPTYDVIATKDSDLLNLEKKENDNGLIKKIVAAEYKAHQQNKIILIRGTTTFSKQLGVKHLGVNRNTTPLLATTIKSSEYSSESQPYSICMSPSLFSGFIKGKGACTYTYMYDCEIQGFTLSINKADYYIHKNHQLLYIPPLTTIGSLFAFGTMFFPRITAATQSKEDPIKVYGLYSGEYISDKDQILLQRRNPIKHLQMFLQFFIENSAVIFNSNKKFTYLDKKREAEKLYWEHFFLYQFAKYMTDSKEEIDLQIKTISVVVKFMNTLIDNGQQVNAKIKAIDALAKSIQGFVEIETAKKTITARFTRGIKQFSSWLAQVKKSAIDTITQPKARL